MRPRFRCPQLANSPTSARVTSDTARSAAGLEPTREIFITFRKTHRQLVQMSLHRVMHPLLLPTASSV
jgi:hypothetical protein